MYDCAGVRRMFVVGVEFPGLPGQLTLAHHILVISIPGNIRIKARPHSMISDFSAFLFPTLASLVSVGMTSIIWTGADARTPIETPNPSALLECCDPDGTSEKPSTQSFSHSWKPECSSPALRRSSL